MAVKQRASRIPAGPALRVRIGIIAPHDMALDAELWRWTPPGAALFFARTPHDPLPVTLEMVSGLGDVDALRTAAASVKAISPAGYAFACTSGSFVGGIAGERAAAEAISEAGEAPTVTASGSIVAALHHLALRRVAVAAPYDDEITRRLADYLTENDVHVTGVANLGLYSRMFSVPYRRTAALIREANTDDAEAIVVACTNLPTYAMIAPLERELGKPVISANQATMWAVLALSGIRAVGKGQRLLSADVAWHGEQRVGQL